MDAIPRVATTAAFNAVDSVDVTKYGETDFDIALTFSPSVVQVLHEDSYDLLTTVDIALSGGYYNITWTPDNDYSNVKIRCIE